MKHSILQTRLIARLCVVLLCIGLLFAFSLNYYLRAILETEVADKARLVFANLLAVQTYVRETLRPAMFENLTQDAFVIEAMSTSYVTRKVMSDLNMARDQFSYRRVALEPRNPAFAANETERGFIRHFQENPQSLGLSRFQQINGEDVYITARPVIFEKRCLSCHGRPEDAPRVMVERYGDALGFGRSEGEIGGLDMLIMPVEREAASIRRVTITFVLVFACGTLIILVLNHFFFDRIMVMNIGRLAALMRSRFPAEAGKTLGESPRKGDEIEDMLASMERFADHLREAKESILKQKTLLQSIFEGIADPLFLLDASGGIVHANESAHRLIADQNGNGEEKAGLLSELADLSEEACETEGDAVQRESLFADGRSFTLRAYPLSCLGGAGRAIVYARDNTVEKAMLARLQQSEKSLAVGKLAAGLAHEINNPLGVILCYARLLWNDGRSENAEDLDIIIRHTLQAQKVLQDLMRFARPKPQVMGSISLAEAAAFIARVFQVKAARQDIVITTDIPPDLPTVRGDASAVEQILTNIVINSMDALEEAVPAGGGRIEISAHPDHAAGEVVLSISDNGPGIPEESLSRVFDPFFSTKEVGKGTGLGLSVVYGLVRDMGGRIEVESRNGAAFIIHLRVAEEAHDGPQDE